MEFVKLGEIADFVRNGASIKQQNGALGIPITRIETISNDIFNYDRLGYADITSNDYENYYLKDYDILMSHINSLKYLGRTVIYRKTNNIPIIHGMNLLCIRINPAKYNPYFFYYYSKSDLAKHYYWLHTKKSVNQASIMASAIKDMPIPLVDKSTQQKIVDVLDNINSLIKTKETELAQLDSLVQSQFAQMFGDKEFPKKKGGDLFKFSSGKFLQSEKRLDKGIPVYGGNGIAWYTKESLIDFDTIIIGRVGAYCGNIRLAYGNKWITDNALYISNFKTKDFNLIFLKTIMEQYDFHQYSGSVAQPKITQKPLENQLYIVPPIELQNKFASFVQQVDKTKSILNAQLQNG